jgi:hypothetical protein
MTAALGKSYSGSRKTSYTDTMTKRTKMLLGILAGVLVLGGLAAYTGYRISSSLASQQRDAAEGVVDTFPSDAKDPQSGKMLPFRDYAQQGKTQECAVNWLNGDAEEGMIVHISKGNIFAIFSEMVDGKRTETSVLVRGDSTYVWDAHTGSGSVSTKAADAYFDQVGDYRCSAWKSDPSLFEIPKGITFKDTR